MDVVAKALQIVAEINSEIEPEIRWHERNESTDSWECCKLRERLEYLKNELKALGY